MLTNLGKRMTVHFYDLDLLFLFKSYKRNLLFLISKILELFSSHHFSKFSKDYVSSLCSVLTLSSLTKHITNSSVTRFFKASSSDCISKSTIDSATLGRSSLTFSLFSVKIFPGLELLLFISCSESFILLYSFAFTVLSSTIK